MDSQHHEAILEEHQMSPISLRASSTISSSLNCYQILWSEIKGHVRPPPGAWPQPGPEACAVFILLFLCDLIKCQFEYLNKQCTTVHIIIFLFEGRPQCKHQ